MASSQLNLGPIPRPAFSDFLRQDLAGITPTWRFEDPFMRAWLATLENQ
jgi:hypothetical protein